MITGQTGRYPIFQGAADFDLELIESRTLDGNIQELIYRPPCMCEPVHARRRETRRCSHGAVTMRGPAGYMSSGPSPASFHRMHAMP